MFSAIVWSYLTYLLVSMGLTVWVARTLSKNGRVFLIDAFSGNTTLADSINHLLVVGFYLINAGYVTLALKYGDKPRALDEAIEFLSTKIGLVLVILGVMHFFNLFLFSTMRRRGLGHPAAATSRVVPTTPTNAAVAALERVHDKSTE